MRFRILMMSAVAASTACLSGCAQATARSSSGSHFALGTYRFQELDRGEASRISGTVSLLPDSATIDLKEGHCQPIQRLDSGLRDATFFCDGAASVTDLCITISRERPEQKSGWSAIAQVGSPVASGLHPLSHCGTLKMVANGSAQVGGALRLVREDAAAKGPPTT